MQVVLELDGHLLVRERLEHGEYQLHRSATSPTAERTIAGDGQAESEIHIHFVPCLAPGDSLAPMPATPVRAAPAPEPLAALLAGLDAFERFANQLDSSSDAQPAISRLASLTSIIDTFEQSDRASETKSTKDTLDQHGSELWNRSTTLHHALKTTAPNEPWNRAFALRACEIWLRNGAESRSAPDGLPAHPPRRHRALHDRL